MNNIYEKKWPYLVLTVLIIVTIILNIVLLYTDIYQGTYYSVITKDDTSSYRNTEIRFYENTYDYKIYENSQVILYSQGFYRYISKDESDTAPYNAVILVDLERDFERFNVFVIQDDKAIYICGFAVFLQLLYAVLIVGPIVLIIFLIRKKSRTKIADN